MSEYAYDEGKMLASIREFRNEQTAKAHNSKVEEIFVRLGAIQEEHLRLSTDLGLEIDAEKRRLLEAVKIPSVVFGPRGVSRVMDLVCAVFCTTKDVLDEGRNTKENTLARYAAMYLLRRRGLSLPAIGRLLRRHHTSVMYGVERAEQLLIANEAFRNAVTRISINLGVEIPQKPAQSVAAPAADRKQA